MGDNLIMEDITQKLLNLEAGDYIEYNQLYKNLEESSIVFETKSIYTDSVGFLEEWRIGEMGSVVVDALNGDPMVRKTQHIKEEVRQ